MTIDAQGWISWAERVPGPAWKVSGGVNPVLGFVAHSAEGYEAYLRSYQNDTVRRASWCLSNLYDGRLLQHYPVTSQCWASGSPYPNNNFVACEHEGMAGEPLTPAQIETTRRVIDELMAWKGYSKWARLSEL